MKKTLLFVLCLLAGNLSHGQTITLQSFATGFNDPAEIVHAGDSRLFVVQQSGQIRILNTDGTINTTPFLNIATLIATGSERGLLGLAFHPQYATNGYFYVNYTNTSGNTVIARYTRSTANANLADPATAQILLTVSQPFSNHNGGCLRFGPDGYLYIGMGDGGSGGDPNNNAQNINSLLGKILRLDVDNGTPYSSPPSNIFVGAAGADEIWATGVRNPWKFSFDKQTGDMWIADVGQNQIEEINKITAGTASGLNFGWRCYEGNQVYNSNGCSGAGTYIMPLAQYTHNLNNGCSITGGYVYRGSAYPNLQGKYVFADYCNSRIGIVDTNGAITFTSAFTGNFTCFGEDINGELYIAGISNGIIYKIKDASAGVEEFTGNTFSVYPNPASGVVNIRKAASGAGAVNARVYDMSGKLLLEQSLQDVAVASVSISTLPAGFYLLNITDTNSNEHSHKLMIE